jgi:predicted DNA-binding transcriptional regulator AlpA
MFLNCRDVAKRYQINRITAWRWARDRINGFPEPVRLAPGTVRWRLADLESWERSRASSHDRGAA